MFNFSGKLSLLDEGPVTILFLNLCSDTTHIIERPNTLPANGVMHTRWISLQKKKEKKLLGLLRTV